MVIGAAAPCATNAEAVKPTIIKVKTQPATVFIKMNQLIPPTPSKHATPTVAPTWQ